MGGLQVLLFIEAREGQYGVAANIMIGLYESECVIKVVYGWVVEDDSIVILWKVAFAHLELLLCKNLMIFLLY